MPPKGARTTRASARKSAAAQQAPPSSEDAKPNVDQLNAEVEAEGPPEPSSDLSDPPPELKIELPSASQAEANKQASAKPNVELPPEIQADNEDVSMTDFAPEADYTPDAGVDEASTPNAAPTRQSDSTGPSRGRGKKSVAAPSRFAGRRSKAKRDQLEQEEQQRNADEAKATEEATRKQRDAERRQAASERGRGGGRGRGRGRGGHTPAFHEPVASGPFSAGQVSKEIQQLNKRSSLSRGSGWKGYRPEGRSTRKGEASQKDGSKAKPDANGDERMGDGASENETGSTDDEEIKGQRRMNVEKLGVIDLTQDDEDVNPNAPIRIARVPHKERKFGDKVGPAIKQEDDTSAKVDTIDGEDVAISNERQQDRGVGDASGTHGFQAVYSDSDTDSKPRIKPEPGLEAGDDATSGPDRPSASPERQRKGKEKARARTLSTASVEEYDEEIAMLREEQQRRHKDLDIIRTELGTAAEDGDAVMAGSDGSGRRADKVYLFQLPPVLPDLEPLYVKPDPDAVNGDVMQVDGPSNTGKPIEINDDGIRPAPTPGVVGKMKVHASGKVTLDWGGMSLSLGLGGRTDFLQTVVSTTLLDQKTDSKDDRPAFAFSEEAGQVINLGHVKKKFVLTPDWEELLG